ncbi:hypothetical protein HYX05_05270 [Candidatus Woesearchaeota archaeon]|nr:hypothetical protein [Candidatus Woesearchaeota archaeon]
MEVVHSLGALSLNRNIDENAGFLLTNKKGSYCSFYNAPSSRYQGLFYFDQKTMNMYKLIENIEIAGNSRVSRLKNGFYFIERKKDEIIELFTMPKGLNSLIYEVSNQSEISLFLDCKLSADNREWGRYYEISEEKGCIIVKFTKKTDKREDSTEGVEEFILYMAIKSDKNTYTKIGRWVERHYPYDEGRNSPPFRRYAYDALRISGSRFVFSMSKSRNDAIKECGHVFNNLHEIKHNEKEDFLNLLKNEPIKKIIKNEKISKEIKIAYISAFNSLNNLIVDSNANYGLFAGFPWFFQFWARDTLISLKALSGINGEFSKKILLEYLNKIENGGRLLNLAGQQNSKNLGSSDAHGWLFLRCREVIEKINRKKEIINSIKKSMKIIWNSKNQRVKDYLKKCSLTVRKKENEYHKTLYEIESALEKSMNGLLKLHTKAGFEVNEKLETWMDTDFGNDDRKGVRIEIQALRLNMYRLMFELTQNQKYKVFENILKMKVKDKFWNGKILADGLNDFTIRPNVFIAAYAYPDLLTQKEWETCFENTLKSLWLDWGGLSTIDKNNPLFTNESTGEYIKSYHRGDSWFWINNLAALTLFKINKNKFNKNIKKIIDASTEEILWKGCIGRHSELSSAKQLESRGCFNQAWSNAMFIELIDGVYS